MSVTYDADTKRCVIHYYKEPEMTLDKVVQYPCEHTAEAIEEKLDLEFKGPERPENFEPLYLREMYGWVRLFIYEYSKK